MSCEYCGDAYEKGYAAALDAAREAVAGCEQWDISTPMFNAERLALLVVKVDDALAAIDTLNDSHNWNTSSNNVNMGDS